jgi:hypothetical protein
VDRAQRELDWMQAVMSLWRRPPQTEITTTPPQLADDGEHWDFGGSRRDGEGECVAALIECFKECIVGFSVRAATNVV